MATWAVILGLSLALQLMAAALAIALIRTTRSTWAWIFVASALVLMTGRRAITLAAIIAGRAHPDIGAELVALLISISMLLGVALIRPVFMRMRDQADDLARKERELRELIECAPDGVGLVRDGALRYANAALGRMLGGSGAAWLVGQSLHDLVHPDERDAFLASLRDEVADAQVGTTCEVRFRTNRGVYLVLESALGPRLTHLAEPVRLLQLRDLSERKRLESELFQAKKLEAIGRLSGGIAHDFNNLLTVITASADIARTSLTPKHPACLELDGIQDAAARAAQLTAQLLAFARTQPVRPTAFDLNQLVTGMGAMLQRVLREDVQLSVELSRAPVAVFADRGQIEQVVLNLVLNARDAMPNGGLLTIRTRHAASDAAQAGSPRTGLIEVSDQGHGIELAVKDRIFEPFFTTKPAGSGTGLGLSSSYGIVSSAGGRIDVDSAPGRGATFRVVLPSAARLASEPALSVAPRAVTGGRGQRILLVEDQAPLRTITARGLRMDGYEVLEADNGISALALLESLAIVPDLLVTDVVMPGMDGSELARRLQQLHPALPILFITGYDQQGFTEAPGAALSVLYKPFNIATLCARVHEILDAAYYPVRASG